MLYWAYLTLNYVLAALLYTCLGRFVLSFFVKPNSRNIVFRFFCLLTDPIFRVIAPITPWFMTVFLLPLYGAFCLLVLRALMYMALQLSGVTFLS